jgi:hypothetical protein
MSRSIDSRIVGKFTINPVSGCHDWTGSLSTQYHYPTIYCPDRAVIYVHRHMAGPAPEVPPPDGSNRWEVHHKCRNTKCINAEHLEWVTRRQHCAIHKALRHANAMRKRAALKLRAGLMRMKPDERSAFRQRLEATRTGLRAGSSSLELLVTQNPAVTKKSTSAIAY